MKNDGLILKSPYNYPQVGGFISVKQYMMIRTDGKKCVLLRFVNELDYSVDSFEILLIKLDKKGAIIGNSRVKYENLQFLSNGLYTPGNGIAVEEKCVDCRVQIISARSGNYRYTVKDGRTLLTHFDDDAAHDYLSEADYSGLKRSRQCRQGRVASVKNKHPSVLISLIVAATVIALLFVHSAPYVDTVKAFLESRGIVSISMQE